jgi:anti-sigma factor RsiW
MIALVDHARATELFSAYWDEELAPTELSALEEHLKSCVVCRREYQTFEKAVGALGTLHKFTAPPDFAAGVHSRIRKRSKGRFFTPRRMAERIPYEVFSLVMLGLILAIYIVLQLSQPGHLKLP